MSDLNGTYTIISSLKDAHKTVVTADCDEPGPILMPGCAHVDSCTQKWKIQPKEWGTGMYQIQNTEGQYLVPDLCGTSVAYCNVPGEHGWNITKIHCKPKKIYTIRTCSAKGKLYWHSNGWCLDLQIGPGDKQPISGGMGWIIA